MTLPSTAAAASAAWRRALQGLQVPQRDRAGFEEIGDQQARRPAEQVQEVPHQAAAVLALVDRGLEQLGIADLRRLAQGAFLLEPVDERLDGRVGDSLILGEAVEDLADGAGSQLPVLLQDAGLGFRETGSGRLGHLALPPTRHGSATTRYGARR